MPADPAPAQRHRGKRHATAGPGQAGLGVGVACLAIALLAATAAIFAWARPTTAKTVLGYTQSGRLSYSAPVPAGSLYDGRLSTGEPVYSDVVDKLKVGFTYQFQSGAASLLTGNERLVATINNGQGITRSFVLSGAKSFHGDRSYISGELSLTALDEVADAFNRAAGGSLDGYTVTISPSVATKGRLGPEPVATSFAPQFVFSYTGSALVPAPASSAPSLASAANSQPATESFTPSSSGAVTVPNARAASFLLSNLKVSTARTAALVLLGLALAVGAFAGRRLLLQAKSEDEKVRIASRYGPSLIPVSALPDFPSVIPVEMSSMAGLMRVSRQLQCPVLHCPGGEDRATNVYAVIDNGTLYRYGAVRQPNRKGDRAATSLNIPGGQHALPALSRR